MKRVICMSLVFVLLMCCGMGCSSKRNKGGSVSGTVTYKGQPVSRAVLLFRPIGEGDVVDITTSQDGTFDVANIPPGEYKICVESSRIPKDAMKEPTNKPMAGKDMDPAKAEEMKKKFQQLSGGGTPATTSLPKKYKDAKTTDLQCTIAEGKQQKLNLDLKD
jgi:hypothetical protein